MCSTCPVSTWYKRPVILVPGLMSLQFFSFSTSSETLPRALLHVRKSKWDASSPRFSRIRSTTSWLVRPSTPHCVWCMTKISSVPISCCVIVNDRMASSDTRPPALRKIWQSPILRPNASYGTSRASMHVSMNVLHDTNSGQHSVVDFRFFETRV